MGSGIWAQGLGGLGSLGLIVRFWISDLVVFLVFSDDRRGRGEGGGRGGEGGCSRFRVRPDIYIYIYIYDPFKPEELTPQPKPCTFSDVANP